MFIWTVESHREARCKEKAHLSQCLQVTNHFVHTTWTLQCTHILSVYYLWISLCQRLKIYFTGSCVLYDLNCDRHSLPIDLSTE